MIGKDDLTLLSHDLRQGVQTELEKIIQTLYQHKKSVKKCIKNSRYIPRYLVVNYFYMYS